MDVSEGEEVEDDMDDEVEVDMEDFDILSEDGEPSLHKSMRKNRKQKRRSKHKRGDCPFYLGQAFACRDDINKVVKDLVVESKRQLRIVRNDIGRFRVVCQFVNPQLGGSCDVNVEKTKMAGISVNPHKKG